MIFWYFVNKLKTCFTFLIFCHFDFFWHNCQNMGLLCSIWNQHVLLIGIFFGYLYSKMFSPHKCHYFCRLMIIRCIFNLKIQLVTIRSWPFCDEDNSCKTLGFHKYTNYFVKIKNTYTIIMIWHQGFLAILVFLTCYVKKYFRKRLAQSKLRWYIFGEYLWYTNWRSASKITLR